jgi:hypothetical protein
MAFNFGGFLNGMSQSIVSSIEEEEKQQRRFELMAEEDAMKQRAARKSERDKRQRVLEESIGALTSLGYSPEAAAQIARGGSTSVSIAKDIGIDALKNGVDIDTLYRANGVSDNMLDAKDEINSTIEAGGGPAGFQRGEISKMYAEPTETQSSFSARAVYLSQKLADPNLTEDKRDALQKQFDANLTDYAKWEAANPKTESPLFDPSKAERAVNAVQSRKLNELKIDTDINTAVSRRLEGDEGRYGVGLLRAADELNATYGKFNDPIMADKISYLRNDAVVNLKQYANNVVYRSSQDTGYKGTNLKQETDVGAVESGLTQSKYRIGDVVTYTDDNGAMRIIVYTGIPMNEAGDRFMFVK